ncbi:AAA family ATPase [Sediminibacillus halophilus]|uniref:AAA domain-containing protein n=1 Tax=Sediminibacillus halophilus TaxID=482461 RepID=A0A1G9R9V6_9BACI|nr:AAA family ATPase [Sediminibacillus halophilus]SDM20102.1 AAA domain-containing protein [Sediminibacillus halophilus]
MKFILLYGPQAVGKMTVGQELEKLTGLKLFHNHMTIELVNQFFDFDSESFQRLVNMFRHEIFEEVSKSELSGLIFTYVWAFDQQEDWDFVEKICEIFESKGAEIIFVELESPLATRLERNLTPHRLALKPTKRNLEQSESNLRITHEQHRLNSRPGEINRKSYLRIDNSELTAQQTALLIKDAFGL